MWVQNRDQWRAFVKAVTNLPGYLWPEDEFLDQLCDRQSPKNDSGMELDENISYFAEIEFANLKYFHVNDRHITLME